MGLNGIDIASWQAGIKPSSTSSDFVIVKVTGGVGYINPYWREWADDVLASGKLLGLYHYANERGCSSTSAKEAQYFIETTRPYHGKFVPVLDWEADATMNPASWAADWMQRVKDATGSTPMFYGYASNVNSSDYSACTRFPLWMASYLSRYAGGGFVSNPENIWDTGNWPDMACYQYTSQGRIAGYGGNLDLSWFYKGRDDWQKMCKPHTPKQQPGSPINDAGLYYQAHVQNLGWCPLVHDGQVAGTSGESLRLEALRVNPPAGWELEISLHVQNIGWTRYHVAHGNDSIIGTVGKSLRIEMIAIEVLKRPANDKRKLKFRVHEQNVGWKAWTSEGYASGTDGLGRRLEAIQIVIE